MFSSSASDDHSGWEMLRPSIDLDSHAILVPFDRVVRNVATTPAVAGDGLSTSVTTWESLFRLPGLN